MPWVFPNTNFHPSRGSVIPNSHSCWKFAELQTKHVLPLKCARTTPTGTVDDKVLSLVNQHLKVTPPLVLEDIEVAHRLGKPPPKPFVPDPAPSKDDDDKSGTDADQSSPPPPPPTTPPRAIKFASRRTKSRVMRNKKNLKDNPFQAADGTVHTVYVSDDLTKRRANLAYRARLLRRSGAIQDTWTYDSQILVKDLHNKIVPIKTESDLNKFQ